MSSSSSGEWVLGDHGETCTRADDHRLATDPGEVDLDLVHGFLTASYWAAGVSRETVERSIAGSIPFTLLDPRETQIGFARVVSDRATFAYLADLFVVEHARGRGLADWMVGRILDHPRLRGVRRWTLFTADAHRLYERHGFRPLAAPDWAMEIVDPQVGPG